MSISNYDVPDDRARSSIPQVYRANADGFERTGSTGAL